MEERIRQELNAIEQIVLECAPIIRNISLRFPDNMGIIALRSAMDNSLLAIQQARTKVVQASVTESIVDRSEELGTILGEVLELKIRTERNAQRIRNLGL